MLEVAILTLCHKALVLGQGDATLSMHARVSFVTLVYTDVIRSVSLWMVKVQHGSWFM